MKRRQFAIQQMFALVAMLAVAFAVLRWLSLHNPIFFAYAFLATGAVGVCVIFFSALLAFSIYATKEQADRDENLKRCMNLAGIGLLMFTPLLLSVTMLLLLNLD